MGVGLVNILTYGTFDTLHYGHIILLRNAKALGDRLIVGLSSDEFNSSKGKASHFDYETRKSFLELLTCVDLIIPEHNWDQKIDDVKKYDIDIFTMGSDWVGKFDFLEAHCKVHYLPRTPSISSTLIKQGIGNGEIANG